MVMVNSKMMMMTIFFGCDLMDKLCGRGGEMVDCDDSSGRGEGGS